MDAEQFDALSRSLAWSSPRRRVLAGLATVLGAGTTLALGATVADAKKKRRRKRKRKQHPALRCPEGLVACNRQCRLPEGGPCDLHADCCSNHCEGECYPTCAGKPCSSDADCCAGVECLLVGDEYAACGGCGGPGLLCQTDQDCCYAQCNSLSLCISGGGERCTTGYDCQSCFDSGFDPAVCAAACVAGTCQSQPGG